MNRRLFLLNEDLPTSTSKAPEPPTPTNSTSPPQPTTSSSLSTFGRPLQLPPRPILTSNVAYAFIIVFTAIFFLGFIILYIRQFSVHHSPTAMPSTRLRRQRRRSHDHTALKSLPAFSYQEDSNQKQQVDCAVCLEEFTEGETVKVIPSCKHVFHPECIDTWLVAHVTCPMCRCTKLCEAVEGGKSMDEVEDVGESTVENEGRQGRDREVGSVSEQRRNSSGSRIGLGNSVVLRRTLSF